MLQRLNHLPKGLLETDSRGLEALLGSPTLIHLQGQREPALFVSVLLHGNEPVGWEAVRGLLADRIARFGEPHLPRALSIFIGNVSAAAQGARRLPGQPDYNRVWPGGEMPQSPEQELMANLVETMARRGVFASIDLHNNTGANPHYACVNRLDHRSLHLATLFGRIVVYFTRPRGVQSMAMAEICPAVTLECGKVDETLGVRHARAMLDAALHLAQIPDHPLPARDIDLYHTVAQMRVPPGLSFGFPPEAAELVLDPEIERLNFQELPRGTPFARVAEGLGIGLEVLDERGQEVGDRFFRLEGSEVLLDRNLMPSMLTRNLEVIRQDCLGYLMERYNDHLPRHG
jgi:succinylglutamate desuccinylase